MASVALVPRRRSHLPQRTRVFVGCEGESEVGYAAFIGLLAEEAGLAVHLDIRRCRGGDPLAIVEAALGELRARGRRRTKGARNFDANVVRKIGRRQFDPAKRAFEFSGDLEG